MTPILPLTLAAMLASGPAWADYCDVVGWQTGCTIRDLEVQDFGRNVVIPSQKCDGGWMPVLILNGAVASITMCAREFRAPTTK